MIPVNSQTQHSALAGPQSLLQVPQPLRSSRLPRRRWCNTCASHRSCRSNLQPYSGSTHPASQHRYSSVRCNSSNQGSNNPSSESLDQYVSIVSASTWQQIYDIFYDYRNAPSYQQCYGMLLQLSDLLPEMQLQQTPGFSASPSPAGFSGSARLRFSSTSDTGSNGSNGNGVGKNNEVAWQALAAAGKVQTAAEVNSLKSLIRDLLRAVQVQLHLYTPHELLDILEAATQLSTPNAVWFQAWEAALQPHLKQLQLVQLMRAAEGLIGCGQKPGRPWAGIWFVALQPHLPFCTSRQLVIASAALQTWGCKPPLSWTEPFMEALQTALTQNNVSVTELITVLGACVTLGLKPCAEWLETFASASKSLLIECTPTELVILLHGLQLLGFRASVDWLESYLHAVHAGLSAWDVASLGSVLLLLGQQPAGLEALQRLSSSSSSNSGGSSSSSDSGSSRGLLEDIVAQTEPQIEQTVDPGVLINLLCGLHAVKFTPGDEFLDLLLDQAAACITASSNASRQQPQHPQAAADNSGSSSGMSSSGSTSTSSNSRSSKQGSASSSSSSRNVQNPNTNTSSSSSAADEQPWLLQAGSYQPGRNINLGSARKHLESSWAIDSMVDSIDQPPTSSSSTSSNVQPFQGRGNQSGVAAGISGSNAVAAAGAAAGVSNSMQASALVVGQVLQLLSVVADMKLPIDRSWVAEVLGALKGHCMMVDVPELQLLLELCQRFGVVLEPEQVDELLVKSHVDYSRLQPEDQLSLLSLLAASQTRPNNIWWQSFLAGLQQSLTSHTPAQLVMLLLSLSEIGGRPPQAWLAAHESALLTNNNHSNSDQALNAEGWLLLLECYGRFMYKPSDGFESALERYMAGVLGPHTSLNPEGLASLVGSVARLQLACSPQLEDGIISSLDQVVPKANAAELQQLIQSLLLIDLQLPSPTLHSLCNAAQPHLATFSPTATCCLLQLIAVAGDYPPGPAWLSQALAGLEPQLETLEGREGLMLLQSLKAFTARPPEWFMTMLQGRLVTFITKYDAMGVATVFQGLAACGYMPSNEIQVVTAGHIRKGLARPSQGMGATPLWLLLEVLVHVPAPAVSTVLVDEVLSQASQQLGLSGCVTGSKMVQKLLPHLAAAVANGGTWGFGYVPSAGFSSALCSATLEDPSLLKPDLWLGLLLRFSAGDVVGFNLPIPWVQVALEQVLRGWGSGHEGLAPGFWSYVPADQLAGLLSAIGALSQQQPAVLSKCTDSVPGWPIEPLHRLADGLQELNSHQLAAALLGVGQMLAVAEQAAAAAEDSSSGRLSLTTSDSSSSSSSIGNALTVSSAELWYSRLAASITAAAPNLLAAAEATSYPQLSSMSGDDLALLTHAMQQLGHTPNPNWLQPWTAAVQQQLPGASGQSGVFCLAAVAAYQAQPDPVLLQQLLLHCQQHMGDLGLPELLAFGRSLQLIGYRGDVSLIRAFVTAANARVELMCRGFDDRGDALQFKNAAYLELQKVLLGLDLQD